MHFSNQRGLKFTLLGITSLAALAFSASAQADTHVVESGDTLSDIANKNQRTVEYLVALNNLQDANHIVVGQEIELGDGQTVPATETTAPAAPAVAAPQQSGGQPAPYNQPAAAPTTAQAGQPLLSNGNSAGQTGAYAASQMEAATGVPASTWEYIIARESNGQVNAYNPSGASGLFQTMPGWGSTATVEDQVQSAIRAYNAQGLSAWGY